MVKRFFELTVSSAQSHVAPRASVDAMLGYAWANAVFTSGDALPPTGLTRSTAIDAIDELIELGLLRELPNARAVGEYRKGRPARRFELDADAAVVIGMDAGRAHLTTTLANLRGEPVVQHRVNLDAQLDSGPTRRRVVVDAVASVLVESGRARDDLLAVCVGVPAPVNAHGASPPHRDGFWSRMNPDLKSLLADWAPVVRVENDASLAAVAEGALGAAVGYRDYVVLLAGDRLGAGVVVDGQLLRGAHGGAGETVAFDHVIGVEAASGLGQRLTDWARDDIAAEVLPKQHPLAGTDPQLITGRTLLELAAAGDRWAGALVERAGAMLARIAGVFGSFYDPARIIVSGALAAGADGVVAAARRSLGDELDLPVPTIVASQLGAEVVAIGAVSAAVEAARAEVLRIRR